jgi:hypothetical protein
MIALDEQLLLIGLGFLGSDIARDLGNHRGVLVSKFRA